MEVPLIFVTGTATKVHTIAKIVTKQPAPSESEESLISMVIRKKHKLPITAKRAIPAHPHKNIIRTKVTSVDIQPSLRIQKAVIRPDASDTVALRFWQQPVEQPGCLLTRSPFRSAQLRGLPVVIGK